MGRKPRSRARWGRVERGSQQGRGIHALPRWARRACTARLRWAAPRLARARAGLHQCRHARGPQGLGAGLGPQSPRTSWGWGQPRASLGPPSGHPLPRNCLSASFYSSQRAQVERKTKLALSLSPSLYLMIIMIVLLFCRPSRPYATASYSARAQPLRPTPRLRDGYPRPPCRPHRGTALHCAQTAVHGSV